MNRIKLSIIDTIYTRKRNIVICQLRVYASRGAATFRSFTGVAKCSPEDNFDFNKGKKLALARAEIKARRYYSNVNKKLINKYKEYINIAEAFVLDCDFQIEHNKNYIKNLIESFDKK